MDLPRVAEGMALARNGSRIFAWGNDSRGLVYALTERPRDGALTFIQRPATFAGIVLGLTLVLNLVFR